eukprot:tig00001098_g7054.t1
MSLRILAIVRVEQMDARPSRIDHRERYEEYFELRREVKSLEERLAANEQRRAADEQRQAADERALRTLLAHIRDHPNSDDSCLYTEDVLKVLERDREPPPKPRAVIENPTAAKLAQYLDNQSVCFVTATGAKYHFARCAALYEGRDLKHKDYHRAHPGITGYVFGSEKEMHMGAKAMDAPTGHGPGSKLQGCGMCII